MGVFNRLVVSVLPAVPRSLVGRVARRYVAGSTLDDALSTVRQLNREGAMATLDLLGEAVSEPERAVAATEEYIRIVEAISATGLDANVSLKPTSLGLTIDRSLCLENIRRIAVCAREHGNFVRLDMEDRTTTDTTLWIYRTLQPELGNLGVVLQAYMRRTLSDIAELASDGANVRLCKGIYVEPRSHAWKGFDAVRLNFLAALEKLLRQNAYVAVATHDEYLVAGAVALIDRFQLPADRYEFQMLLGVAEPLRQILISRGHRLRVYVPYGRDWYAYSLRRLRENPAVAGHVMRAFFAGS
jgi:proline dehydrogenase